MSFLIFAFSPLSLYSPSVSIPYDSTNWRHLWIKIGIPVLVSCCSDRGIPDTWVCLRADIHDSASAGFSALRWYVLCNNIVGKGRQNRPGNGRQMHLLTYLVPLSVYSTAVHTSRRSLVPWGQSPYEGQSHQPPLSPGNPTTQHVAIIIAHTCTFQSSISEPISYYTIIC